MSAVPWIVTTLCVAANGVALYAVVGAIDAADPARLERGARIALWMLAAVIATAAVALVLSGGTRAGITTSAAFAVFFGVYPAAAARWLGQRARRARDQR